jgi:hypothetical protein
VQLDPVCAELPELAERLREDLEQGVEQAQAVEVLADPLARLAQQEVGHGADQSGLGLDAEVSRLRVLVERLRARQREAQRRAELRDDVVVVGVEPLRHLHGCHVDVAVLAAASHREVGVEPDITAGMPVAGRDGADESGRVEHLVVVGEVVRGDQIDPGLAHEPPVLAA